MAEKAQHRVTDLVAMWRATFFEFPIAGTQWAWGVGKEQEAAEAAWKGYDAWVRLANAQVDELYRNPLFGDLMARSLDEVLRWQRFSSALVNTFFAGLWPAVGLPTAAAVQALRGELHSLTTRLKAQDIQMQTLRAELRALSADLPAHRRGRAPVARLNTPLETPSAKVNGHRTATAPAPLA